MQVFVPADVRELLSCYLMSIVRPESLFDVPHKRAESDLRIRRFLTNKTDCMQTDLLLWAHVRHSIEPQTLVSSLKHRIQARYRLVGFYPHIIHEMHGYFRYYRTQLCLRKSIRFVLHSRVNRRFAIERLN